MIVVIVNGGAGGGNDRVADLRRALEASGRPFELVEATGEELVAAASTAVHRGATAVVAAGGDGTVNAVASALVGTDVPLGVIPMGTLNHFARDAGIPLDVDEAVTRIGQGVGTAIDVGEVGGRCFLNNASIGVYPMLVRQRDRQRSRLGRSKWWAMVLAGVALFRRFPLFRLAIDHGQGARRVKTPMVVVGNNRYSLDAGALGRRDRLDQGTLSLHVVRTRTRRDALRLLLGALLGRLDEADTVEIAEVDTLTIDAGRNAAEVGVDGEVVTLPSPLHFRVRPGALQVLR